MNIIIPRSISIAYSGIFAESSKTVAVKDFHSDPYPDAYPFQVTTGRNSSRDSDQHGSDNIKNFLEKIRNSFYLRKLVSRKVLMLLCGRVEQNTARCHYQSRKMRHILEPVQKMETYFRNRR